MLFPTTRYSGKRSAVSQTSPRLDSPGQSTPPRLVFICKRGRLICFYRTLGKVKCGGIQSPSRSRIIPNPHPSDGGQILPNQSKGQGQARGGAKHGAGPSDCPVISRERASQLALLSCWVSESPGSFPHIWLPARPHYLIQWGPRCSIFIKLSVDLKVPLRFGGLMPTNGKF